MGDSRCPGPIAHRRLRVYIPDVCPEVIPFIHCSDELDGSAAAARGGCALMMLGCGRNPVKPYDNPRLIPIPPVDPIQKLAVAYQRRDYPTFENLFPNANDNAPYLFILAEPLPNGQTSWDRDEELRIHRRMFDPENPLPGETPVPEELWLQSISIVLTQIDSFIERPDLYESPTNPDGLDANERVEGDGKSVPREIVLRHAEPDRLPGRRPGQLRRHRGLDQGVG